MKKVKVLYEELKPCEFRERLKEAPIAYLPLGTLEWHGEHMPLGADGLQSQGLFERLATEVGGIVLPKLFLGPDMSKVKDDAELYGMDIFQFEGREYPEQKLEGSAYYVPDELFKAIIEATVKQLSRAGFKILVAHGHGPSTNQFISFKEEFKEKYGITCFNCFFDKYDNDWNKEGFQVDHGGMNETSIVMALRPDLVDLSKIDDPENVLPKGICNLDPRIHANPETGNCAIDYTVNKMSALLKEELKRT